MFFKGLTAEVHKKSGLSSGHGRPQKSKKKSRLFGAGLITDSKGDSNVQGTAVMRVAQRAVESSTNVCVSQ